MLLLMINFQLSSQNLPANNSNWEEVTQGYSYPEKEGNEKIEKKSENKKESNKLNASKWLKPIAYIIASAILLTLLIFLFRNYEWQKRDTKMNLAQALEAGDEEVLQQDLQALINEAVEQQHWSLAVRLQFLMTIKILSESEKIIWRKKKTNLDYFRELDGAIALEFEKQWKIYDKCWFGDASLSQDLYSKITKEFIKGHAVFEPIRSSINLESHQDD